MNKERENISKPIRKPKRKYKNISYAHCFFLQGVLDFSPRRDVAGGVEVPYFTSTGYNRGHPCLLLPSRPSAVEATSSELQGS